MLCDELKGGIIAALCSPVLLKPVERHHLKMLSTLKNIDDEGASIVEEELLFDEIRWDAYLRDEMTDSFSCSSDEYQDESIEFSVQYFIFECLHRIQR